MRVPSRNFTGASLFTIRQLSVVFEPALSWALFYSPDKNKFLKFIFLSCIHSHLVVLKSLYVNMMSIILSSITQKKTGEIKYFFGDFSSLVIVI